MNRKTKSCCFRSFRNAVLTLGLAAALALLPSCSQKEQAPDTLRVGVALYTQDDTFISTILTNMERLAQETEQKAGIKINLSIADGRSNQTTQLEQVDRFLDRGYDILCVNIVDRTAAAVLIDKAQAADVPLIFFNRQPVEEDIQRWEKIYYVGADAAESGILQGQLVLDAWRKDQANIDRNGDGVVQYAILEGEPGHQDALLRTEHSVNVLTDAGVEVEKLASESANWNRAQAAARTTQWIETFGDRIEVIFSNNDDMALGAIDALEAAGAASLPLIVGVDATEPALKAIEAGKLYATVRNDGAGIAQSIMDLAIAISSGEDPAETLELVDEHYIWLPYRQVTRENLSDFLYR